MTPNILWMVHADESAADSTLAWAWMRKLAYAEEKPLSQGNGNGN